MDDKLLNILAEVFEVKTSDLSIDLKKIDIGSWDSLKQMDLVLSIENSYDIILDMEEIVKMTSIKSIVDIVKSKKRNDDN